MNASEIKAMAEACGEVVKEAIEKRLQPVREEMAALRRDLDVMNARLATHDAKMETLRDRVGLNQ